MRRKKDIRIPGKAELQAKGEKSLSAFWIIIACSLPLLKGIINPYWISYPPIGEVTQWWPLNHIAVLYPAFTSLLIFINIKYFKEKEELSSGKLLLGIRSLLLLFIFSFVFLAIRLYLLWYNNPVGKYLLWSPNSYYLTKLWEYARPYVFHLEAGLLFGVFFYALYILTQSRVMERSEPLLAVLVGMIHGIERTLYIVIVSFALTVIWMGFIKLQRKEAGAMRVTPALFVIAYLALYLPTK